MPTFSQTEAWQVGPTIDTNRELSAPLSRQEDFQIEAATAPIDLRAAVPRPLTHRMDHSLMAAPSVALTRSANENPAAAGEGDASSTWGASGAVGEAAGEGFGRFVPLILVGAAVGLLIGASRG